MLRLKHCQTGDVDDSLRNIPTGNYSFYHVQRTGSEPQLRYGIKTIQDTKQRLEPRRRSNSSPAAFKKRNFNYVNIIVSGYYFKTLEETLQRFPNTLLGNVQQRELYWSRKRNAYIFNRCRQCFDSILYFYQSGGSIIQPVNVEQDIFIEEAKFFKLPLLDYFQGDDKHQAKRQPTYQHHLINKIWRIINDNTTLGWKALALFDVSMTFVYVTLEILRSTPDLRKENHEIQILATECTCMIWFAVIFGLRLYISESKKTFMLQFMSVVDIMVIVCFLLNFTLYIKVSREAMKDGKLIALDAILRITGFLRLFNMARYSDLLFCLGVALKRSLADLAQVMVLIFLVTFMFATLAYYIEETGENSEWTTFISVFDALYWGTITISTVGYGDISPKSTGGKFVGATLALLGLPLIAIPMPLIMSKFDAYYQDIKRRKESNDVRNKIMEEIQQDREYDAHPDHDINGGYRNNNNIRSILPRRLPDKLHHSQDDILVGLRRHSWLDLLHDTSTSSEKVLAQRRNMSWMELVKETYQPLGQSNRRICFSFSDLSNILDSECDTNRSTSTNFSFDDLANRSLIYTSSMENMDRLGQSHKLVLQRRSSNS